MLKKYKSNNDYGYYDKTYYYNDIVQYYTMNKIINSYYKHWCDEEKMFFSKGYINIGVRYSHWLETYHIFNYYL